MSSLRRAVFNRSRGSAPPTAHPPLVLTRAPFFGNFCTEPTRRRISTASLTSNQWVRPTGKMANRFPLAIGIVCAAAVITCVSPTDVPPSSTVPPPSPQAPGPPASLEVLRPPGDFLVEQMAYLTVYVRDSNGVVLSDYKPAFRSVTPEILEVSSTGVLKGLRTGTGAVEVTLQSLKASISINVTSRLRIGLVVMPGWLPPMKLAVGDTVRLKPYVIDANGRNLEIFPKVKWSSSNPSGISVDSSGKLVALIENAAAEITASGENGFAAVPVEVSVPAGGMATVRFANAASEVGAINFVPTKGSSAVLTQGLSATIQVPPGMFLVEARGSSADRWDGVTLRSGDRVTVYAMGDSRSPEFKWIWGKSTGIPADSARIEVVQTASGRGWPVIFAHADGDQSNSTLASCYFDPMDSFELLMKPGTVILVMFGKPNPVFQDERQRIQFSVSAGKGYTIVLEGTSATGVRHFAFPEL